MVEPSADGADDKDVQETIDNDLSGRIIVSEFAGKKLNESATRVLTADDGKLRESASYEPAGLVRSVVRSHEKRGIAVLGVAPPPDTVT